MVVVVVVGGMTDALKLHQREEGKSGQDLRLRLGKSEKLLAKCKGAQFFF
jgi:hypothetical protein